MNPPTFVPAAAVTPDQVMRHARRAMEAACAYFQISSEWEIELRPSDFNDGTEAQISHDSTYMTATIEVNLPHFQAHPERIWRKAGHEVAHLVTSELGHVWRNLPEDARASLQPYQREAIERATVRLERMFARDCPDPGVN